MERNRMHGDAGRRGSALIITLFLGVFFASIGYYTYVTSVDAKRESSLRENQAKAQAMAEFATELAMANLSDMDFQLDAAGKRTSILRDWVGRQLFKATADQRRIAGSLDGYDYRVRVRSAREAYSKNTMPAGWLIKPDDYAFGTARPDYFTNIYELTAVARNANPENNPAKAGEVVVRTVVDYHYQSPLSDQDKLAVLHMDDPAGLLAPEASISGEDHYSNKVNREDVDTEIKKDPPITKPKRVTATNATFKSAIAQYWTDGRSILNFRVGDSPNPYVPATRGYGTGNNQKMVAYDSTKRADYYFLGGKLRGRTVTLTPGYDAIPEGATVEETGKEDFHHIVETSYSETAAGDEFEIAVGSYEDLGRIYLTVTEDFFIPLERKKNWYQNAVGQITLSELPYKLFSSTETPFFNTTIPKARRPLTRHYIMNLKGQILVREYPNSAYDDFYYPSRFKPNVNDAWTGYYVWTDKASVMGIAYYEFPEDTVVDGVLVKKDTRRSVIPRSFEWEEIQGYELIRDEKGVPTCILRDSRGVPVPWPVDAWGARKNVLPLRAVRPDLPADPLIDRAEVYLHGLTPVKLEYEGKPFYAVPGQRVDWQKGEMTPPLRSGPPDFKSTTEPYGVSSPITLETSPERRKEILAGRIKVEGFNEKNQYGKQTRPGAPGVDFFDGKIRVKEMNNKGELEVKEYSSMAGFKYDRNIGESEGAEDFRSMTTFFICTEDLPEEQGPDFDYGDMSYVINIIPPVDEIIEDGSTSLDTSNNDKNTHWWIPPANNSLTGGTSHTAVSVNIPDEIRRIADPVERLKKTYELLGLYDPDNPSATFDKISSMIGPDGKMSDFPRAVFIIGGPDNGKLANPVEPGGSNIRYYTNDDLDFFFSFYDPMAVIPGSTKLYSELPSEEPRTERREFGLEKMRSINPAADFQIVDERFNEGREQAGLLDGALGIPNRAMTSRQYASSIFGHQNKPMPVMGVDADGRMITPETKSQISLGFLPGEWRQKDGATELDSATSPDYVPLSSSITVDQKQPNGDPVKPRLIFKNEEGYAAEIRSTPEGVDIDAIQEKYGLNDRREGLGWHRGGLTASDPLLLDFFEYIILGDKGYIPYSTVAASGKQYLAGSRKPVDKDGNTLSVDVNGKYYYIDNDYKKIISTPDPEAATGAFQSTLKAAEKMPTFVFSGETLDGAGVLVVNGNLDIQTLFAYNGILIVLGDLTTTPTEYKDAIKYGEDGNPMDAEGNSLRRNKAGKYYYMKDDKEVIAEPVRETVVRGDLVLQGKALVSGKIKENEVTINGVKHKGNIDIRYSKQAIEDVLVPFTTGNEKFVAERLGWSSDMSLFDAGGNAGNVQNLWDNAED